VKIKSFVPNFAEKQQQLATKDVQPVKTEDLPAKDSNTTNGLVTAKAAAAAADEKLSQKKSPNSTTKKK
jgi:hypothetical protein